MREDSTQHSQERFDHLYQRYADDVRRQIRRIVRDSDICEDVLQETFLRVWNSRKSWCEIRNFKHWLLRIGTNLALNHLRSKNRSRELQLSSDVESDEENFAMEKALTDFATPGPESEFARKSERDLVRRLIAELPEDKRIVLELVDQRDLSIREASDILEIPGGTVKSRLFYGRQRLTGRLRELFDLEEH